MTVQGLDHNSIVCAERRRAPDFDIQALEHRFVKKIVDLKCPPTCHLYFGNQAGASGPLIGGRVEGDLKPLSALDALPVGGQ